MYDNSIEKLPEENDKFHFFNYGIGYGKDFYLLDDIIAQNGHSELTEMILKMDIEGFEYQTIYHADPEVLSKFSQIVIEFHDIINYTNLLIIPVLQKLNEQFQCVHIHGQDVSPIVRVGDNRILPNYIEVTYLNKNFYEFTNEKCVIPLKIDMPTYRNRRELYLGDWSYY